MHLLEHKGKPSHHRVFRLTAQKIGSKGTPDQQKLKLVEDLMANINPDSFRTPHISADKKINDQKEAGGKVHGNNLVKSGKNKHRNEHLEAVEKCLRNRNKGFSLKKLTFQLTDEQRKKAKKLKLTLFKQPELPQAPKDLSKKSTQSETTASEANSLREQNEKIKEVCQEQLMKLARLEMEINHERKVHRLVKQLYQQNIDKLKQIAQLRIVDAEVLQSHLQMETNEEECGEDFDQLQIQSH